MKARDLMTTRLVTVPPETAIPALARLMAERGISAVPVMAADGRLLGLVSEADLLRRIAGPADPPRGWIARVLADPGRDALRYAKEHGGCAGDLMTTELVTAAEDTRIEEIARLMEAHGVKRIPVLRDGRLVGIVSRADLLRALAAPPAELASDAPDARILRDLRRAMEEQPWVDTLHLIPSVQDGVVTFHGWCGEAGVMRGLRVLAGAVPGVRRVEDETVPQPRIGLA